MQPRSARQVTLERTILWQVAACVVPAMALVAAGTPALGARWLFASLLLTLLVDHVLGRQLTALAVTIGAVPALMLLRNLFLYNSVVVLLVGNLAILLARSPGHLALFLRHRLAWISYIAALYWISSVVLTGDYYANLRTLELAGGAASVVLLARHRAYLATTLYALLGTIVVIGIAFLPSGDRLGSATIGGVNLGNPISYGLPLALLLLVVMAERGRWLLLQRNTALRVALMAIVGALLLLSTSRGSWLVAGAGVMAIVLLERSSRRVALIGLVVMLLGGVAVLHSARGKDVSIFLDRTFNDERSLGNRTSGRSDQWVLFPTVMEAAPPWGYGPGRGPVVYSRFSAHDPRIKLKPGLVFDWHSIYLQFGVEVGALGLGLLLVGLGALFGIGVRHWTATGEVMPIVGTLGFCLVGLTVSGLDAESGMYLGFALLASPMWSARARRRSAARPRVRAHVRRPDAAEADDGTAPDESPALPAGET